MRKKENETDGRFQGERLMSRIHRESRQSTKSRPQQVQQKSSADVTDRQRPPTHRERHRRSIAVDTPR